MTMGYGRSHGGAVRLTVIAGGRSDARVTWISDYDYCNWAAVADNDIMTAVVNCRQVTYNVDFISHWQMIYHGRLMSISRHFLPHSPPSSPHEYIKSFYSCIVSFVILQPFRGH